MFSRAKVLGGLWVVGGLGLAGQAMAQATVSGQIYDPRSPNAMFRQYKGSLQMGETLRIRWKASSWCHLTLAFHNRLTGQPITDGRGPVLFVGQPTSQFDWNETSWVVPVNMPDMVMSVRNPDIDGIASYIISTPRTLPVLPTPVPSVKSRSFTVNSAKGTISGTITLQNLSTSTAFNMTAELGDRTNFQTIGLIPITAYTIGNMLPNAEWTCYPTFSTAVKSVTLTLKTVCYGNTYTTATSFPIP